MKIKLHKGKQLLFSFGLVSFFIASATDVNAQKLNFTQKITDGIKYRAPMAPENIWVTDYKGTSFVMNWKSILEADSYILDVFTTDKNSVQEVTEDFSGINSTDGYINASDPHYPEGWNIDISTFGDKDMAFDGNNDRISLDATGDFIRTPDVNGYITSCVINMNVINIPQDVAVNEENTSAIIFRLYDDHNICVKEGTVSTLIFAEMPKVDLFLDLFSSLPPTITSIEFALEKNEQRMYGDVMVNSIAYGYAPRKDLVKDANVGNVTNYKVENTDPETIYFCNVRAVSGNEESAKSFTALVDMLVTPEPVITEQNKTSFTLGWQAVPRAQYYDVYNYNVLKVTEDSSVDILKDDFNQNTEGTFDAPVNVENPDECTKTAGWIGNKMLSADGMFGADNGTFAGPHPNPGFIQTPIMDLSGNGGKYKIHIKAHGTEGDCLSFYRVNYIVDGKLNIHKTQKFPANGMIEETWEMEDGAADMRISIEPKKLKRFFLDEISITQERKAGEVIKMGINKKFLINDPKVLGCTFDNLIEGNTYGYEMRAMRQDDAGNTVISEMTDFQIIVLVPTGIEHHVADNVTMSVAEGMLNISLAESTEVSLYTINGKMVENRHCNAGNNSFNLSGNIYIVKIGTETYKILVK